MLNNNDRFYPSINEWFRMSFGEPTDVQLRAWHAIQSKEHTLIAAPTGSGKTLAALLPCLDAVIKDKLHRRTAVNHRSISNGVRIVYITPLKALNNDIYDHLIAFIKQIDQLAEEQDSQWPGISCAVRTGDTTSSQRAAMLRRPPDILVTTPESLYILLTSEKGRGLLQTVEFAIVDEIHDLAADKRGSHLSLTLERLQRLCARSIQRIGVSATQKPLDRVGRFLGGWEPQGRENEARLTYSEPSYPSEHPLGYKPRPVTIVESMMQKKMEVSVTMPDHSQPMPSRESVWLPLLDRLFALMTDCRSVLLFVNSRRLCERLCLRLNDHAGYEMARAHHGSMAKERRLEVERMLKQGELRCIVATSSLELGIDVGHIDLVIQLDSPLAAASGIQRMGRAGHAVGSVSRGVIVARQRGSLAEIAVLSRQIAERDIEPIEIPRDRLDVLSQQTVSIVASEDITMVQLHQLISHSDSYRSFPPDRLYAMVQVLAGLYPFARPLVDWNQDTGMLSKRKNSSIAALTGAGTIPSSSAYPVHHVDSRVHLGELDEEFVQESRVGDVFQLGTNAWMIRKMDKDRVYVGEAANNFSEIPFWRNEGPGRSFALGVKVGQFTELLEKRLELQGLATGAADGEEAEPHLNDAAVQEWLKEQYGLDGHSSAQLISLLRSQHKVSELSTHRRVVIEHYKDVMNQTHVIIHNPFGRRVNRTWLLAIEQQFEKLLPYRLYGNAKDNGIEFVLPEWDPSWLQSIWHVTPESLDPLLMEAITGSPLLAIAFRHIAETSLLLSRSFTRTPLWQKRLRSEELLREALPFAQSFPFLSEAMRECMNDYLDIHHLGKVLEDIRAGHIEMVIRETEFPSPMAAQFLADYVNMRIYEGDGLDAAVQMQLMNVSKELAGKLFGKEAVQSAIPEQVLQAELQRMNESGLPLHEASDVVKLLKRRGDISTDELIKLGGAEAASLLSQAEQAGDIILVDLGENDAALRWICRDEANIYRSFPVEPSSVLFVVGRFADYRLSFTEIELCERYPQLSLDAARRIVGELLKQGMIEQSPFAYAADERIWSSRKAAARMIRLSIGEARKQVEPVMPIRWCSLIAAQQYVLQGTQLRGSDGLRAVIERLQGLFLPVSHWESIVFPSRMVDYRKEELDLLCSTGEVIWLGSKQAGDKEGKIAFFLAASKSLYEPYLTSEGKSSTAHPQLLKQLQASGASFLTRISRDAGLAPTDALAALLELAWEGHVSNDQFAPLRLLANKKGKDWARTGSGLGRWYSTGALAEEFEANAAGDSDIRTDEQAEPPAAYWIRHLLDTYGIVTKELVATVTPFQWDQLLPMLKKLEEWGTITRGIFIDGAMTMQFTTPAIGNTIRATHADSDSDPLTLLSAVDPANPFGLIVDWPQEQSCIFARKSGNFLVIQGDQWLYWIESNGKRIHSFHSTTDKNTVDQQAAQLKTVFRQILHRQQLTKLVIERWNGEAVTSLAAGEVLKGIGAERDQKSLVLWLSQLK